MNRRSFIGLLGLTGLAGTTAWPRLAMAGHAPHGRGPDRISLATVGFDRRTLVTPIGDMAVFEAGDGDPLLLLHGVGAGASSFIWFRLAPLLSERYRVIAPDFIGWGESDRPDRPILFDDYVVQIRALGDSVGQPLRVIPQSLTCGFALTALQAGGIPVERMVLHGPSGGLDFGVDSVGEAASASFRRALESPQAEAFYARIFHQRPAVEDWYRQVGFLDPQAVPPELIEAGVHNARQPNAAYSALPFLAGSIRYDIAPLLRSVRVPTLMLWGEEEVQIRSSVRTRIEQVNPDIPVERIPGARSVFEVERPRETAARLLPFLEGGA